MICNIIKTIPHIYSKYGRIQEETTREISQRKEN